jgi:hypothetical protein
VTGIRCDRWVHDTSLMASSALQEH